MDTLTSATPDSIPNESVDIIKVSATSRSTSVAGAIAGVIRQHHHAEVQAIGAGAVYQAVKAIAIARKYLSKEIGIMTVPIFTDVLIDEQERTAIRFIIEEHAITTYLDED
jgi:stage V sporulation protein S